MIQQNSVIVEQYNHVHSSKNKVIKPGFHSYVTYSADIYLW